MTASFESTFKRLIPAVDFCSLRFVEESTEQLVVRQNVAEPPQACIDRGVMIVGWASFICPPCQCFHAIPAWAVKACPPYKMIILSINTSRLIARLFIRTQRKL